MVSIFKHLSIFLLPTHRTFAEVDSGQYMSAACTTTAEMLCLLSTFLRKEVMYNLKDVLDIEIGYAAVLCDGRKFWRLKMEE